MCRSNPRRFIISLQNGGDYVRGGRVGKHINFEPRHSFEIGLARHLSVFVLNGSFLPM